MTPTEPLRQTVIYNEKVDLYIPEKQGYIFKYWEYNGQEFTIDNWNITNDIELTAVWEEEKTSSSVVLETFGGTLDKEVEIKENGDIILPSPKLDNYKFKYWCSDKQLTNKITSLNISNYNGEILYAYYECDFDNL